MRRLLGGLFLAGLVVLSAGALVAAIVRRDPPAAFVAGFALGSVLLTFRAVGRP